MMNSENSEQHYSHAPIREALIDIRVKLPHEVSLETMATVGVGQADYPTLARRGQVEWNLSLGSGIGTSASETPLGYAFSSRDEHRIFQARLDGFTFSWTAPYQNWQALSREARRLWTVYRDVAHPEAVTRIAVRYINRLDLPLPLRDFSDYLRTLPEVSPHMSQGLSNYFMQLQLPQEDLQALLILNEALLPPPDPEIVSVLLDIDLFRSVNIPTDEDEMWKLFDAFRLRKNQIFEACITDRMRELIR